jgi:Trypsin
MPQVARRLSVLAVLGVCLALAPAAGAARQQLAHPAIVGGSEISIVQAPWQVAVEAVIPEETGASSILCGGSILDSSHILTAAHCVFDSKTGHLIAAEDFTVHAGTADLGAAEAGEQERAVTGVRAHPYYVYAPAGAGAGGGVAPDDVAVLTLQQPLALGSAAATIPLLSAGLGPQEGTAVNLTGFGRQNPEAEVNGKLYSLAMTVGYSRECGGENDAVLLCAKSPSGTPCNGDSGSALTLGSPALLAGVEDDYFLISGQKCATGAKNALANVAAPEIQDFLDGSEEPPRAPRGGGAVIREAPINAGTMSCEPGHWSGSPAFTYTFFDSSDAQILQQGPSTTYAVPAADLGHLILCQVQASNAGGTGIGRTPPLNATAAAPLPPPPVAAAPTTTPPPATGHVSLAGTQITVQHSGAALVKLECVGEETCRGKLTLTAKITTKAKGRKRPIKRAVTIGTVRFSIAGEETKTVKVNIDAAARALLNTHHGRLTAGLTILELAPGQSATETENVHLVQQTTRGKTKR